MPTAAVDLRGFWGGARISVSDTPLVLSCVSRPEIRSCRPDVSERGIDPLEFIFSYEGLLFSEILIPLTWCPGLTHSFSTTIQKVTFLEHKTVIFCIKKQTLAF